MENNNFVRNRDGNRYIPYKTCLWCGKFGHKGWSFCPYCGSVSFEIKSRQEQRDELSAEKIAIKAI